MALAQTMVDAVAENPDDAPPETLSLAREARDILKSVTDVLVAAPETANAAPARARAA
jgi:hypothetical protein